MGASRFFLMGTICIAALAGCAHSEHATGYGKAEPSGFLKDYSKLHAAANDPRPSVSFSARSQEP
jgi:hypothetical protein